MTSVAPLRLRVRASAANGIGEPVLQIEGVHSLITGATDDGVAYYTPGNEGPAVSLADYYHTHAGQYLRPWDLDAMGAPGAAVKAANGGNRYYWILAGEHPEGGSGLWRDSYDFKYGFSNDPGVFPSVMLTAIPAGFSVTGDEDTPNADGETFQADMHAPTSIIDNPEDEDYPFYMYTQTTGPIDNVAAGNRMSVMWKSDDLVNWRLGALSHLLIDDANTANSQQGLTAYQTVERRGTGDWVSHGIIGLTCWMGPGKWTSTDGTTFTCDTTIYNADGYPSVNFSLSGTTLTAASPVFTPDDDGKSITIYYAPSMGRAAWRPHNPIKITYVSSTVVTISVNPDSASFSNVPAVVEYGTTYEFIAPKNGFPGYTTYLGQYGIGGEAFLIGDQLYRLVVEDARHEFQPDDDGMYVSLAPIDEDYNASQVLPAIRVSSQYSGFYPGPGYLYISTQLIEDGILHTYTEKGNPGPHNTGLNPYVGANVVGGISGTTLTVDSRTGYIPIGGYVGTVPYIGRVISQSSGTPGGAGTYVIENPNSVSVAGGSSGIYINGGAHNINASESIGRLNEQFLDYHTIAIDSVAASNAAPFGVAASCDDNEVTISWMSTPLGVGGLSQSYNVYRGDVDDQDTLVGNTASTSMTDTPTPGQVWYYRVVKVSGGSEQSTKYRVVHTYVG